MFVFKLQYKLSGKKKETLVIECDFFLSDIQSKYIHICHKNIV